MHDEQELIDAWEPVVLAAARGGGGCDIFRPFPADSLERASWTTTREINMGLLGWALIFLVVSVIAGIFGFGGVAAGAAGIARLLFGLFLLVFLVLLVMSLLGVGAATVAV